MLCLSIGILLGNFVFSNCKYGISLNNSYSGVKDHRKSILLT